MDKQVRQVREKIQVAMHRIRMLPNLRDLANTQRTFVDMQAILDMIDDGHSLLVVEAALRQAGIGPGLEVIGEKRYHRS